MIKTQEVLINPGYITLGQLLKLVGLISFGGMAKQYLQKHQVFVNNINDQRRGRKLYPNDHVLINGIEYLIKER